MTQEEKNLILIDLCGRLPYDIVINEEYGDYINVNIYNAHIEHLIDRVVSGLDKMVLRPMSSMTEEERKEYNDLYYQVPIQRSDGNAYRDTKMVESLHIDWLNKNMFDYRGLIPKGSALEAPEGMYNNKTK